MVKNLKSVYRNSSNNVGVQSDLCEAHDFYVFQQISKSRKLLDLKN